MMGTIGWSDSGISKPRASISARKYAVLSRSRRSSSAEPASRSKVAIPAAAIEGGIELENR